MYYYKVNFQNTGYIEDGILTIKPDEQDGTEIVIEKYEDNAGFLSRKVIDVEEFLRANATSDAEDARKTAYMHNRDFQRTVNDIASKIIQESEKGNFGTTYSTHVYNDDTLDAVKHHFVKLGYDVSWTQTRGVNCSERVFTIRWA